MTLSLERLTRISSLGRLIILAHMNTTILYTVYTSALSRVHTSTVDGISAPSPSPHTQDDILLLSGSAYRPNRWFRNSYHAD
jgi:hypothetical protein